MSTITVDRAVLERVLEALEFVGEDTPHWAAVKRTQAITALRDALAQEEQEQEPVAWSPALTHPNYEKERVWLNGKPRQEDVEYWSKNGNGITYAYAAPIRQMVRYVHADAMLAERSKP